MLGYSNLPASRSLAVAAVALVIALAGCDSGGSSDEDNGNTRVVFGVALEPQVLSVGSRIDGTLSPSDSRVSDFDESVTGPVDPDDDTFLDAYELNVGAGRRTMSMTSSEVDAFLTIADFDGTVLAEDDDGGSGLNARMTIQLEAGSYIVVASSFEAGEVGAYTLSVE